MVTTSAADNLGPFTATLHGSLTDMGTAATVNLSFQYGTTSGSLASETTPAAYSSTVPYAYSAAISGLTMGTRYYFRAKAVGDATGYGDELFFDTLPVPTVTTTAVTAISNVSATSGGNVTADNGTPVTARGVCWNTTANPTTADSHTTDGSGTGSFSSSITPLAASTVYHVRAYATNTAGTGYGADIAFTTAAIVTASAGSNGSLDGTTPSPVIVNYNSTTSFKFNADTGYHVASVSGCSGAAYSNTANAVSTYTYTTGAVTGACTVTATFAINTYTITATSGANGSVTPAGVTTINYDGSQSYSITPGTGFHIVDVLVDGSSVGAVTSYSFSNVTANHTISATFAINTYTVTASAGSNGSLDGTTPSPVTVNHGSTASFTFNADAGYHVASISGCGGTAYTNTSNAVSSHTFTTGAITAACEVSATFAINQYTVNASTGANGALDAATPSPITVNHGDTASFKFNANTGYHVSSISGCGGTAYSNTANAVNTHTYTTAIITSDCTVTAAFAINRYTVSATAGANGALAASTPSPITVDHGDTPSFLFNADTGHHVASVSGCFGTDYSNTANSVASHTYTCGPVTADCAVTATFAINRYTVNATAAENGTLDAATPSPITVNYGDTPFFIFNANTGYHVTAISGCGGTAYTNTTNEVAAYTYTTAAITADCTVAATFAINVYQVNFFCNTNGHLSGNLSQTLDHGQNCSTVTAIPDLGYRLLEWSGDYAGSDNPLTIRKVTANMAIHAVFHNDPPR